MHDCSKCVCVMKEVWMCASYNHLSRDTYTDVQKLVSCCHKLQLISYCHSDVASPLCSLSFSDMSSLQYSSGA